MWKSKHSSEKVLLIQKTLICYVISLYLSFYINSIIEHFVLIDRSTNKISLAHAIGEMAIKIRKCHILLLNYICFISINTVFNKCNGIQS